jgi:DNA-binding transcriptional regulator YhcF (GntR family)
MSSALLRGVELARYRERLGRLPSTEELAAQFGVNRATAYRYCRVLRGKSPHGGGTGKTAQPPRPRRARRAEPAEPTPEVRAVMREFGLPQDQAAAVLAYDRGEALA